MGWLNKYKEKDIFSSYDKPAFPYYPHLRSFKKGGEVYSTGMDGIFPILKFADGGSTKQPITVSDPNDPRLKAYNDSLNLYNESIKHSKDFENNFATKMPLGKMPTFATNKGLVKANIDALYKSSSNKPINYQSYQYGAGDDSYKNINFDSKNPTADPLRIKYSNENPTGIVVPLFAKPVQEYKIKEKEYPNIYLSDPNDSRLGRYTKEGNQFVLGHPIVPVPKKMNKIDPSILNNIGADIKYPNKTNSVGLPNGNMFMDSRGEWMESPQTPPVYSQEQLLKMGYRAPQKKSKGGTVTNWLDNIK
jgi:hypothetical protein